jgi:hypothetical protein
MFTKATFLNRDTIAIPNKMRVGASVCDREIGDMERELQTAILEFQAKQAHPSEFETTESCLIAMAAGTVTPLPFGSVQSARMRLNVNTLGRQIGAINRHCNSIALPVNASELVDSDWQSTSSSILAIATAPVEGYPFWAVVSAVLRCNAPVLGRQIGAMNFEVAAAIVEFIAPIALGAISEFLESASLPISASTVEGHPFWAATTARLTVRSGATGRQIGDRSEALLSALMPVQSNEAIGANTPIDLNPMPVLASTLEFEQWWASVKAVLAINAPLLGRQISAQERQSGTARFQVLGSTVDGFSTAAIAANTLSVSASTLDYEAAFVIESATMLVYASNVSSSEAEELDIYQLLVMGLTPDEANINLSEWEGWNE